MNPGNILQRELATPFLISDPGDAGTIFVDRNRGVCNLVSSASAETRTLGRPAKAGLQTRLALKTDGGGDITVTVTGGYNEDGDTTFVLGDAGDFAEFVAIDVSGTLYWSVVAQRGTNIVMEDTTVDSLSFLDNGTVNLGTGNDVVLKWNGTYLEGGPASGLWAGAPSPADPQYHVIAHEFFDDFHMAPTDANLIWHETDDGGTGTNALSDAANGVGTVVTAAADNDHHAIDSIGEVWKFAAGKKLWFEARFKLAEAATNESAWWFGFTDTLTTGGLQADAAGPLASYDGALIWKDEGTLTVDFETSNAGTQATAAADATFVSNKWSRVGMYFDGTATTSTITPYYDMNEAGVWTVGTAKTITLSGLEEMHLVAGVKAGPSGNAETLQIDYIKVVQLR